MKKMLLFFLVLLVMAGLSAVGLDGVGGEKTDSVKAYIDVTDPASQFVYVGFSSKPVTQENGELKGMANIEQIPLTTQNSNNGKAANGLNTLYVYGQIYTNITCSMKLSATSLKGFGTSAEGTPTGDYLGFAVTGTPITPAEGGTTKTLTVVKGSNNNVPATPVAFIDHKGEGEEAAPSLTFECYDLEIVTTEPITSGTNNTGYYSTQITAEITTN